VSRQAMHRPSASVLSVAAQYLALLVAATALIVAVTH
jgi:hypothetical protein